MAENYEQERKRLERRRQLADALTTQLQQSGQGQMVSGHYVTPGILSAIAPIASQYFSQTANDKLDSDERGLESRRNEELAKALQGQMALRQGQSGAYTDAQAAQLLEGDQQPQVPDYRAADPKRAMIEALSSQFPEIQALGKMDIAQLGRKPESNIKEAGGRFFDLSSGKPVDIGGTEYGEVLTIDGDKYQRGPGGKLVKLDNATRVSTNVSVGGDKKRSEGYGKAIGEAIAPGGKSYEAAQQAQQGLMQTAEAANAITQGAKTGTTEPAVQWLRKFGESLGIQNAATAPTETLSSALKAQAYKSLGGLGAQVSNSDRDFVTSFTGDLASNPEALKRMIAVIAAGQIQVQNRHNRNVASTARQLEEPNIEEESGIPLNVTIGNDEIADMVNNILIGKPSTTKVTPKSQPSAQGGAGTPGKPLSLDEYLRMKGAGNAGR